MPATLLLQQARPAAGHRAADVETLELGGLDAAGAASVLEHEAMVGRAAGAPAGERLAGLDVLGERRDARQLRDLLGAAGDPALRLHGAQFAQGGLLLRAEAARVE